MLRIKNSLIKKAIAAGLMIATVMGTSIPTFASEWHYGYLSHGDIIFKTRMNGILMQADMQSTTFIKTDALMKVFL